jgi:transcriptional regulator with XRE-family HTH domain
VRIRHLREERHLTAETVAERAGLSSRGLIYVEHGKRNPGALTLMAIADALAVPVGDLFTDGGAGS